MASGGPARVGYLLPTEGETRVRRARHALVAGTGAILVLASLAASTGPMSLQGAIDAALDRLPGWWEVVFWVAYGAAGIVSVLLVVLMLARGRQNPSAARDVLLAVLATTVGSVLLMVWQVGSGPDLLAEVGAADPSRQFPVLRVAVVTAIVLTASPHVTTVVRRFGTVTILTVAVSALGLGFGFPTDALAAVGVGMLGSGAVLLLFGAPGGFPPVDVVADALRALGVDVAELELATDQSWGVRRFVGVGADGRVLEVKAHGKDAVDSRLAQTLWRAAWYRDSPGSVSLTRMQAVEHEALMTLFAARAGVSTVDPVAAGRAGDDVAILAVHRHGARLRSTGDDGLEDRLLVGIWRDVARLHAAGMAHGSLTTSAVTVADGQHWLGDFTEGSLGAGDERQLDVVNLLFTLADAVGVPRAVASASAGLGRDGLAAALPYLQLPALVRDARGSVEEPKELMAELRAAVADATGAEPVEPIQLRRVSVGQILVLALLFVAANALLSQLADLDFEAVWEIVRDASWPALLLALPVSQLTFLAEAGAMVAAVGQPLPRRPLVILQSAARFIGLAVPSAAGRVAMNTAFLIKFGLSRSAAIVQGAVDSVFGFAVEAVILVVALLLSDVSLDLDAEPAWGVVIAVVAVVAVAAVVLVLRVERVRALVLPVLAEAVGSVSSVLVDPGRTLRLLGNNLLSRVVLGVSLWLVLRGVGVDDVSIPVAIVVLVATNLLAGLVPVPGGIGVAEAVMTSWLVLAGVPEEQAFAATVVHRLWTFYLPAVQGVVASHWLERNDYL